MKYLSGNKICFLFSLLLLHTPSLYAYLDPGTGSMLLAAVIGIASTLIFTMRGLWRKILVLLIARRSGSVSVHSDDTKNIVFYSEGGQYWHTFSPVIRELHDRGISCSYLSSDENDEGLQFSSPHIHTEYIGRGNRAYTRLNLLKAGVCVMTTPNLDTLQIRRSKGVSHYTHIVHAPTDIHLYKLFAFDFYDSIMISGPHQERSIRHLEQLRNTPPKRIFQLGCPYMDVLYEKKSVQTSPRSKDTTLLIAPTWGQSSILNALGKPLLDTLAGQYKHIIVRPHPQSFISEMPFIEYLQQECSKNIVWDRNPDNFNSLHQADILLSDRSGIIFDFAFIFEGPVITHTAAPVLLGMEGKDIPWQAWELDIAPKLGASLSDKNIDALPDMIQTTLKEHNPALIRELRKDLYNLGSSGALAADILLDLTTELAQPQQHARGAIAES